MGLIKRVEVEFMCGDRNIGGGYVERRVFERAENVIFAIGEYLHVQSSTEGDLFINLKLEGILNWFSSEPISLFASKDLVVSEIIPLLPNGLIPAIKVVRARLGYGLKEAKEFAEYVRDHGVAP